MTTSSTPRHHPAFRFRRSQFLTTLNLNVEEYEHIKTGAMHYHLASDNPENVFLVALRTVPMDSTGVAHILEHTALCGSKRFPVRDPFFMMIRRSMNTFMNAFTSSDWTAYPFASQNPKDFNNLLEVYLDAVFFSNLNPLDFAQEGHRMEFSEPENPDSELVYKGVVFNEMKGAMSAPASWIWQKLTHHLFPTTTYHYNSGGEPADIPALTYEQLKKFYETHYHPSNAMFMTFGNLPAESHQEKFEELALNRFDRLDVNIAVDDEQRYSRPIEVTETYPADEDEEEGNRSHVVMAWLLGKSTDLEALYKAQLLSSVLLDNSASPLLQALETTSLGRSPSPLCGLEDSHREMSFLCGLEGCAPDSTASIKDLILGTLQKIADEGIEQDKVEAALHSLELSQREISGDSYPYGLQLILAALSTATHRGDPIELLDIDPVLETLKERIKDPDFIPDMIRSELLDNPHRILLTVHPDTSLAERQLIEEKARLAEIQSSLTEEDKAAIICQTLALQERQEQIDDISILPKVELSDVPAEISWPARENHSLDDGRLDTAWYSQGTNGIAYEQVIMPLPALPDHLLPVLGLYTSCLPELGIGDDSYLTIQSRQSGVCGGISAFTTMRNELDNEQAFNAYMVLSTKGLNDRIPQFSELLYDMFTGVRFDEKQRIHELVEQIISRREQSITSQGHALAMGLAASGMSPLAQFQYNRSGVAGIKKLKELGKALREQSALDTLCSQLSEVHSLVQNSQPRFLLVGDENSRDDLLAQVEQRWGGSAKASDFTPFTLPEIREPVHCAWLTNTQVNFCAKAYPTVPGGHEDCAALTVLGGYLRNAYLHKAIREQGGAYGGGATQDAGSASFRFFSYRDPRLTDTLQDYDNSVRWLLDRPQDPALLEEAILGVISSLDKPVSPAGTATQAYFNELFGRTREERGRFRQRVLNVDIDALRQVAEHYLHPDKASIGIISSSQHNEKLKEMGLEVKIL